jgi:ubiquinone/menaquinone biosynthesis C-methylase UbiE
MLDKFKVRKFWDERASSYDHVEFESIANLEEDKENLKAKILCETSKVFSWLGSVDGMNILDLGAGVGQWALRFSERGAKRVVAVEFSDSLAEIGRKELKKRKLDNIEFVVSPAELFTTGEKFDLVFCSGLCVYLNDDQFLQLAKNLPTFLKPKAKVLMREGMAVGRRHEINDEFSDHLQVNYSATYRTRDEYIRALSQQGLLVEQDENVFPEGHNLNKYSETRLHLFSFLQKK